ncbi:MAG: citryl-CoA lyase [Terriglobales bacterium]|jgi:citrate synthase
MEAWRTGLVEASADSIRICGYEITALMRGASFADIIFLLHRRRLPEAGESALLNAILVSGADHGPGAPSCATARLAASGNRESLSAAVAAGVLAIGNEHGGAGTAAMEMIAAGATLAAREGITLTAAAERAVAEARAAGRKLPGLGHRVHNRDPRTQVLFDMAREQGVAGAGVEFVTALQEAAGRLIKPLPINIDGALAAVLHDLGFPPEAGKLIFIVARVAGLTAEVAEEHAREKPMRIRIPVTYDGPPPRPL